MTSSHTIGASLPDGLSDHELTYQLIQLETRLDLRIGDVPAAQIIRAACRRIELKNRLLGSARELLEEWVLASDNFDMEAWVLRVRNMLEGSNPFNVEATPCYVCEKPVEGFKPQYCCNGHECGCMGQMLEPPICSQECWDKLVRREVPPKPAITIPIAELLTDDLGVTK